MKTSAQEIYNSNYRKAGSWMRVREFLLRTNTHSRDVPGGIIFTMKDNSELMFQYALSSKQITPADWYVLTGEE